MTKLPDYPIAWYRAASDVLKADTLNALVDAIDMSIREVLPASLAGPLAAGLEYRCTHSAVAATLVDLLGAPCNRAKLLQFFGPSFYPDASHTSPGKPCS